MADTLNKPSINRIIPPDPNFSFNIKFQYDDAQFKFHRVVIVDPEADYTTVYDKIKQGTALSHTVDAKVLSPGKIYEAQVQVFDYNPEKESEGNSSPLSEQTSFYCFTTPLFEISNINNSEDGEVIKSASVTPVVTYFQAEGETIRDYKVALYDQFKVMVESSPIYYGSIGDPHSFYSLENNKTYYIRATGETVNGITLDTGYIKINVAYSQIPATSVFELENVYDGGYINIQTNIKDIEYDAKNYTIEDGVLTIENGYLKYFNGFNIDKDGYINIGIQSLPIGEFFKCQAGDVDIFTIELVKICENYYFWLKSDDYNIFAPLEKNYIKEGKTYQGSGGTVTLYDLAENGYQLYLEVIRKDFLYDLRINYVEK